MEPTGAPTPRRIGVADAARGRLGVLVLLLVVAIPLLFSGLGFSFLDPDEGLYADVSRSMLASGDWVLPRFNGLPYLEKPPLYFWLGALTLGLHGPAEWSLRVWSAAAALGTVLLAWRIGDRLYGAPAGALAGLALAANAGYALYVRKASTDFVFAFCLTLAMYGFLRDAEQRERGRTRFFLLYLGAALGLLAKGLIGVVFPLLIVTLALVYVRRLAPADLNLARGLALFSLVSLPWHLTVLWRQPDLFRFYLIDNQILRFLNLRGFLEDDVPMSAVAFVIVSFLWCYPWGVFVLGRSAADPAPGARWRPVVMIWAWVVLGFFVLSRSRLEYYALPAFPALAVLAGAAWSSGRDIGRWLWIGCIGSAAVGAMMVWIGAHLTPDQALSGLAEVNVYYRILRDQGLAFPFPSVRPFGILLQTLGVTLLVGWTVARVCWSRGWRRSSFAALVGHGIVIGILVVQVIHIVEPHHSVKALAQTIRAGAAAADVVVHEGALEYSAALPFYSGRQVIVLDGARGDLDLASRLPAGRDSFVDARGFQQIWNGGHRVFLVTQRDPGRSAVSGVPPDSLHLLGRFGSRWLYSNRGN